ncbi:hypothetical protein [Agrobacterium tomkonis]|uniref:hypothetical protein n=1 Tax=Agrobacterium tomkonis TaxID=1183410 RepID=UPI001CD87A7B
MPASSFAACSALPLAAICQACSTLGCGILAILHAVPEFIADDSQCRYVIVVIAARLFTRAVTVSTCHALAMRLVGMSFTGQAEADQVRDFDGIVMEAVTVLKGDGLSKVEAEALRETLIQGFRWILVD